MWALLQLPRVYFEFRAVLNMGTSRSVLGTKCPVLFGWVALFPMGILAKLFWQGQVSQMTFFLYSANLYDSYL